jgi:hypothetical protein
MSMTSEAKGGNHSSLTSSPIGRMNAERKANGYDYANARTAFAAILWPVEIHSVWLLREEWPVEVID